MLYFAIFCVDNNNRDKAANNETDYTKSIAIIFVAWQYFYSIYSLTVPYCQFQFSRYSMPASTLLLFLNSVSNLIIRDY